MANELTVMSSILSRQGKLSREVGVAAVNSRCVHGSPFVVLEFTLFREQRTATDDRLTTVYFLGPKTERR